MDQLHFKSAVDIARLIRKREISATETLRKISEPCFVNAVAGAGRPSPPVHQHCRQRARRVRV